MKFLLKNKFVIASCFIILALAPLLSINAAILSPAVDQAITSDTNKAASGAFGGVNENTAAGIVATVIKAFLGLLGVIFIFLVVIAGYKYMTANGDEGQVEDALGRIKTAIIGLIIIVSAYAITAFVFKNISTDGSGGADSVIVSP